MTLATSPIEFSRASTHWRSQGTLRDCFYGWDDLPAASISSMMSWGVYLIAAMAMVGLLAPGLARTYQASTLSADIKAMKGVCDILGSLAPGTEALLRFQLYGPEKTLEISDGTIFLSNDSGVPPPQPCIKGEPTLSLDSGVQYEAYLHNGTVTVRSIG